jgi:hypothetical protein
MGDSITEATTAQEKQALISTKLKKLMVDNNFTLGQFSESFKYFVSTANSANMTLDDTYALLATLNSSGVMGSRAGTQLRSGITSMLGNLPEVAKQLGIIIDLTKESPMEAFSLVLEKVKEILESGEQVKFTEVLDKVFGGSVRAGEGLKALVTMMDTYKNNLRTVKTTDVFKEVTDSANQYKDVIEQLSTKLDRLNQTKSIIGRSFLKGFLAGSGADVKLNDLLDKILNFNEAEAEKFGEKVGKGFTKGLITGLLTLVSVKVGADFFAKFFAGAKGGKLFESGLKAMFTGSPTLIKEVGRNMGARFVSVFGSTIASIGGPALAVAGAYVGYKLSDAIINAVEANLPAFVQVLEKYKQEIATLVQVASVLSSLANPVSAIMGISQFKAASNFKKKVKADDIYSSSSAQFSGRNDEATQEFLNRVSANERDSQIIEARRKNDLIKKILPASVPALNLYKEVDKQVKAEVDAKNQAAGLKYEWEQIAAKIKKSNESLKEYEDSINNVFSDTGKRNAGVVKAQDELNSSIKEQVALYNAVIESNK